MRRDEQNAARAAKLRRAIGKLEEALRISYEYLRELEGTKDGVPQDETQQFILGAARQAAR